jgi:DNA-binding beta-propeller fold protein YncE
MQVMRLVDTAPDPEEVLVQPGGRFAWISSVASHTVSEFDLATWKITRKIVTGNNSDGIAWAGGQ